MLLPLVTVALLAQSVSVTTAVAPCTEQFRYHFDNPSSFNTTELVPHFFEQRYDVIPVWFSVDARYGMGGAPATTTLRMSLRGRTRGSDIDTFRQPSGDVATSGTDGDVTLRSWELSQRLPVHEARGWSLGMTLAYRRDRADFLPDDRIVTHTMPASTTRTFITDRETTVSQTLALGVNAVRDHVISDQWHVVIGADVQPLLRAQLMIQLPDKYPGVDLTFVSLGTGARAHWTLERRARRWRAGITVSGAGAWSYRSSSVYSLRGLSLAMFAGTTGR